jgi:DNA-binding helix-hairpin-helix protein with protein kinase domain
VTTFECRRTGRAYNIGRRLDHGGNAVVHAVNPPWSNLALKRYLPGTLQKRPDLEARIKAMIANPPAYRAGRSDLLICTWPEDLAYVSGRFAGYLMPRVDTDEAIPLPDVATSAGRSWHERVVVAENLARAVAVLHEADVVVGDFRERNLLTWSDGRVTLLGCDRMQVVDPGSGRRFTCVADHDVCTPPELLLASLMSTTLRPRSSDIFPLAIQLHLLLLKGVHPFRGRWSGHGPRPTEQQLAQAGLWCYAGDRRLSPHPGAVPLTVLPDLLRLQFRAAFVDGARNPDARPRAHEWLTAITGLRESLVACQHDTTHVYSNHLPACPWCPPTGQSARMQAGSAGYLPRQPDARLPATAAATPDDRGPAPPSDHDTGRYRE